jgi:hypothetical protein
MLIGEGRLLAVTHGHLSLLLKGLFVMKRGAGVVNVGVGDSVNT